jgi:hypothetical protein
VPTAVSRATPPRRVASRRARRRNGRAGCRGTQLGGRPEPGPDVPSAGHSPTGDIVFTSDGSAETALAAAGRYPDDRSDSRGAEFEGAAVASLGGRSYAFVGSERGDAVLVNRIEDESAPRLVQVLATGHAPEGLLTVQRRRLFLTSNEGDGTISVFGLRADR